MIFHQGTLTHQTLNVPITNLIMYKTLKLIHTLVPTLVPEYKFVLVIYLC